MSNQAHTPPPYSTLDVNTGIEIVTALPIYEGAVRGALVAKVPKAGNPNYRRDAAFIVRAVNNHAALVGMVRQCIARMANDTYGQHVKKSARALLAKLDGDTGNAGCDRCGMNDRAEGSKYCGGCQ